MERLKNKFNVLKHVVPPLGGLLLLLCCASILAAAPATQPARTKAQVDKIIDDAGKTPPPWWNTTRLNVPPTLDLSWKENPGKWNNQKNIGAYLWDIIDPNPNRWKEGVKLIHHTLSLNKSDPGAQQRAMRALAKIYAEMLQDHARGAFWAKKSKMDITLAQSYIKLGCPDAARAMLNDLGMDTTRNGQAIKLWAEMGDLDTALEWAQDMADFGYPTSSYLAAGDACRRHDKFPEAIKYYQKVLAVPDNKGDNDRNKKRAAANIAAVKLFDALDLAKIPDGTYKDKSLGYVGPVETIVTVKDKKIESVKIGAHKEKQFYASFDEVPPQIISKQSVKGIDMTTGATITSEAIVNATAKALAAAQKP